MNKDLYHTLSQAIDEHFLKERLMEMIAIKSENPFDEKPRADQGIIGEPCDLTVCPTNKGQRAPR